MYRKRSSDLYDPYYDRYKYYYYDRNPYRDYYYYSQIGRIDQNLINYGYMRDVNQIANQYQYMYDWYRRR